MGRTIQRSVEETLSSLGCLRGIAFSYAPEEELLYGVASVGTDGVKIRHRYVSLARFPVARRAIDSREIEFVRAPSDLHPIIRDHVTGPVACFPVVLNGNPLAVILGELGADVDPESPAWRSHVEEVCARAALIVELHRVYSAYQDELRLRRQGWGIASSVLEGEPLPQLTRRIADLISERLRVERMGFYVIDENSRVVPVYMRKVSLVFGEAICEYARRSPFLARARASDGPYFHPDLLNDEDLEEDYRVVLRNEGISAVLMGVLRYGRDVKGVLTLYPEQGRRFTASELAIFRSISDQATLAVCISQHLDQQRDRAMTDERNRLSREIHDTLAQSLTGLVLQLETASAEMSQDHYDSVSEILASATVNAKQALDETRRAVQGLAPVSIGRLSASEVIAAEGRQFEELTGIQTQFVLTGAEIGLSVDQRTALLRVAREALTNARRHAQPTRIRIGLQFGRDTVTLRVEDDGSGFDIGARPEAGAQGGFGLFGMEERVRLMGGELAIQSTVGWGTRIQAQIPYRRPAPTDSGLAPSAAPVATPETLPISLGGAQPTIAEQAQTSIRVLVADDHVVTRQGIRALLEGAGDIHVVAEAADGVEAIEMVARHNPDVVLMDVQMPRLDGLNALKRLSADHPDVPVVIVTSFHDDGSVQEALRAGARGYLLKDADPLDLIAAVRAASRGGSMLAPSVTDHLSSLAAGQTAPALSEMEADILRLLAGGARNKEMAAELFIAPKTIEYHLSNIFGKLGVANRTEAVKVAIERGFVSTTR
jgi:DNA-binding NarL/FixJ family response regulator/signal transduction histidine kinase